MDILLVVAHPRPGSLTHQAAAAFARTAGAAGHRIDWADLVAEGFDPVLREADEPDWANGGKVYSPAVRAEMARIERNAATVMVFPVWWWSMPAVLKGWIDRVWNNGWAYGGATYPHARVLALAVVGGTREATSAGGYDRAMQVQIEDGILRYCGVAEPRLALLYDALEGAGAGVLDQAARIGAEF